MASNSQVQFWNTFTHLKRDAIYVGLYHAKVENFERWLSIFAAISGSSAIGGWLIWKEFSFFWATVIALSQLHTVIQPYLPYSARLRGLTKLGSELNRLALDAEEQWYSVAHGRLADDEIHKRTISLKRKCKTATEQAFPKTSLPKDDKLFAKAVASGRAYMEGMTGV